MGLEPATVDDPGYCDVEDVEFYIDRFDDGYTEESSPSKSMVEKRISSASSKIDSYTNHAWRERRIVNEMKDMTGPYRWNSGLQLKLTRRDIRTPLDSEKGDKIEIWTGSRYIDFVEEDTYTEGRDDDYWINEQTGTLYLRRRRTFFNRHKEIRITYRFGKEKVPAIINECTAKFAAADIIESDLYRIQTPGNEEAPDPSSVAQSLRETAKDDLEPFKEVRGQGMDMFG